MVEWLKCFWLIVVVLFCYKILLGFDYLVSIYLWWILVLLLGLYKIFVFFGYYLFLLVYDCVLCYRYECFYW